MKRRSFFQLGAQFAGGFVALPWLPGCGGGEDAPRRIGPLSAPRASGAMASPRTYATGAGGTIYGGRFANALLELLQAAPANSWIKANTNTIQDVFPASDYIATYDGSQGSSTLASAVIRCWSGFGWDSNRSRIVLYGGGHANYDGNEVYVFDGATRQWSLAFYPSDVRLFSGAEYVTVDGPLHAPVSSHTYGNNVYLTQLDRFMSFGGAAAHTGGALMVRNDPSGAADRKVGAMTLDLSQAGTGRVGGVAGSNVQHGAAAGVSLAGANAWSVRDWLKDHPMGSTIDPAWAHVSSGAAHRVEGGKDVIYKYSFFNQYLWRITLNDSNYLSDSIVQVMNRNPGNSGWDCAPAIGGNLFLALGGDSSIRLHGFDISTYSGAPAPGFTVSDSGIGGPGFSEWLADPFVTRFGIAYDTINARFLLWNGGGKVFSLTHSGSDLTTGWVVTKISDDTGTAGATRPQTRVEMDPDGSTTNSDTGTLGKWKWAPDLNAFVALQHNYQGNVWIYKPDNWVAP